MGGVLNLYSVYLSLIHGVQIVYTWCIIYFVHCQALFYTWCVFIIHGYKYYTVCYMYSLIYVYIVYSYFIHGYTIYLHNVILLYSVNKLTPCINFSIHDVKITYTWCYYIVYMMNVYMSPCSILAVNWYRGCVIGSFWFIQWGFCRWHWRACRPVRPVPSRDTGAPVRVGMA